MNEERERIRCRSCDLVQWNEQPNCRRCDAALPQPIVKVVERVVEKVVIRQDPECLTALEQAQKLIATASERLSLQPSEPVWPVPATASFPTLAEVERVMIIAAYQKSSRKPLEAARLLGIGKTTFYRKFKEMNSVTARCS